MTSHSQATTASVHLSSISRKTGEPYPLLLLHFQEDTTLCWYLCPRIDRLLPPALFYSGQVFGQDGQLGHWVRHLLGIKG